MASQIEIQTELNRLVAERSKIMKEQTDLMRGQVALASGFAKALRNASPGDVKDAISEMSKALEGAGEAAANASEQNKKMGNAITRAFKESAAPISKAKTLMASFGKQFPIAAAAVAGFVDGLVSGFKFVVNSIQSVVGLATEMVSAVYGIGKSIIAIPFKIFEGLIDLSNKLAEMMDEVRRATEAVRKEFGDITTGPGKDIIQMSRNLSGTLTTTGLTGYKVFGNLAERMAFVAETAKGMGASFETFRHEMVGKTGAALLLMQKGLGLTGEDMGAVTRRAMAMGTSSQSELIKMTKVSTDFGTRFDLSAKLISRDMAFMIKDVKNFGNMAPVELAKISVFAKKLGLDVKDLLGVVDKFDTFEDAATSAAKMSQAFGANVDAIAMMREENPAKRIQMMRDAFFAAGNSAEKMGRQELKLLAQTTGLSEDAAKAAFSMKNMGVSMDDLDKQGKISEKGQISQEQALVKLSDAIDRMTKSFGSFSGFLQAFGDGFARGVFVQKDFMGMMVKLRVALIETKMAGIEVGKAFVEAFPGLKELVIEFGKFFDMGTSEKPGKFKMFLNDITGAFKTFFKALGGDGQFALPTLFKTIQKSFFANFMPDDPKGKALKENFTKFLGGLGNVAAGFVHVIAGGIEKGISIIIDLISGKGLPKPDVSTFTGAFMDPISKALSNAWPKIVDAFKRLWKVAWPKIKDMLVNVASTIGPYVAGLIFGPALLKSFISVGAVAIFGGVTKTIGNVVSKLKGLPPPPEKSYGEKLGEFFKSFEKLSPSSMLKIGVIIAGAGAAIHYGGPLLASAAAEMATRLKGIAVGDLAKAGLVLMGFGVFAALVVKIMPGIVAVGALMKGPGLAAAAIGLVALGVTMGVIAGITYLTATAFSKIPNPEPAAKLLLATAALFAAMGPMLIGVAAAIVAMGVMGAFGNPLKNIRELIMTLVDATIPAVMKMGALASQITDVGKFRAVMDAIVGTIEAVGSFTGSLSGIVSAIEPTWFDRLRGDTMSGNITKLTGFIDALLSSGINSIIDKIILMASGFSPQQIEALKTAAVIGDILNAVANTAKAVMPSDAFLSAVDGGIFDQLGRIGSSGGHVEKALGAMKTSVTGLMQSMKDNIIPLVNSLLGMQFTGSLDEVQKKASVVSSMLNAITEIGKMLGAGTIEDTGAGVGWGAISSKFTTIVQGIQHSFTDRNLESLNNSFSIISSMLDVPMMNDAVLRMQGLEAGYGGILDTFRRLDEQAAGFTKKREDISPAVSIIEQLMVETNAINDSIASMSDINIDARLQELAGKLGISAKEFTVNHRDFKVVINLNVTMEADKVADAVILTKKVMKVGE